MLKAFTETLQTGLSRIEISYYTDSHLAEDQLLADRFAQRTVDDLDKVQRALNSLSGICYRVPLLSLLGIFSDTVKVRQLYIEQPLVCALVYARNDKRGNYTGFFHNIWKTKQFDRGRFILAHVLPGPNSLVHCFIDSQGDSKQASSQVYRKDVSVS